MMSQLTSYMNLALAQFTKTFAKECPLVRIVNISSICAIDPFLTMGVYWQVRACTYWPLLSLFDCF